MGFKPVSLEFVTQCLTTTAPRKKAVRPIFPTCWCCSWRSGERRTSWWCPSDLRTRRQRCWVETPGGRCRTRTWRLSWDVRLGSSVVDFVGLSFDYGPGHKRWKSCFSLSFTVFLYLIGSKQRWKKWSVYPLSQFILLINSIVVVIKRLRVHLQVLRKNPPPAPIDDDSLWTFQERERHFHLKGWLQKIYSKRNSLSAKFHLCLSSSGFAR